MENKTIGFVGGGNMPFAIVSGMLSSGLVKATNIIVSAKTNSRLNTIWKVCYICSFQSNIKNDLSCFYVKFNDTMAGAAIFV